jgi:hypothetical protein
MTQRNHSFSVHRGIPVEADLLMDMDRMVTTRNGAGESIERKD